MMNKKFLVLLLCACFCLSLVSCGPKQKEQASPTDTQAKQAKSGAQAQSQQTGTGSQTQEPEPLLGPDSTDEELLEVLHDEIHAVTDDNYIDMMAKFQEDTKKYAGQIYQIEGSYTSEDQTPYLTRTLVDGDDRTTSGLPLKYLTEEPEEGAWIRVTGIVNEGEVKGKTVAVLEAVVVETLDKEGKVELPVH